MGELVLMTVGIVVTAAVFIFGAAQVFVQVRSRRSRPRSPEALKTAIEIYNLLDKSESENQRAILKSHIDNTILDIYLLSVEPKPLVTRKVSLAPELKFVTPEVEPVTPEVEPVTPEESASIEEFPWYNPTRIPNSLWDFRWYWRTIPAVMLLGFTYWTVFMLRDGFSWGAAITGYGALLGLLLLVAGRGYIRRFFAVPSGAGRYMVRVQLSHLNEVEELLKNHSYQQAIEECNFIIQLYPETEGAFWYRANAHKRLGNKDDAIHDYEKFISLAKKRKYITVAQQNIEKLQQDENKVTGSSEQ